MDDTVFLKSEQPGGLSDIYEIKILICYLLNEISYPLSPEQINYVFQYNNIVNYFSFCHAIKELISTNHIEEQSNPVSGKKLLHLTSLGENTAKTLCSVVGKATRDRIVSTGNQVLEQAKKDRDHRADITRTEDGYLVHMVIHDIGSDLMDLTVFAPDEQTAEAISEKFLADTAKFYQDILDVFYKEQ